MSKVKTSSESEQNSSDREKIASPLVFLLMAPLLFVGSLTFGIFLLSALLFLMAWGTFVESEYGTTVAQFVLYANVWFYYLIALLALNIFFSMLLRFPWKRFDMPFLVTHIGILLLLFGCYLTWQYGEEAQITLPEGTIGRVAVKLDKQKFELRHIAHSSVESPEPDHIPFRPGPFSWQDYEWENWIKDDRRYKWILWHAMRLGHRDKGELSTGDPNVKIETLDYYANSALEPVPPLDVSILWHNKTITTETDMGETREIPRNWELVRLDMRQRRTVAGLSDIRGVSASMSQGEQVTYSLAMSQEELTAFRMSRPQTGTATGLWGEIILYYGGNHYSVSVDQLRELPPNGRFPVGNSGLQIVNADWFPIEFTERVPRIRFAVSTQSGEMEAMVLLPGNPEMNVQARKLGVFGSYWVDPIRIMQQSRDHADNPMLERLAMQRLDFIQGPDKKLYYRLWSGQRIVADGVVPDRTGQQKPQFKLAEQTADEVEIVIDRFFPQDVPGGRVVSAPIGGGRHNEQRVLLRVTFDGKENTFWLRAATPTIVPLPPEPDQIRYVYGNNRTLGVQLNYENIDLGFGILLKQSEKRNEPGTSMRAYSASLVDYVEPIDPADTGAIFSRNLKNYRTLPGGENILISLNRPGDFNGYRIYHSASHDPYYPDHPLFHELYDGTIFPWETRPRESIAMSVLSVNADSGRGWKYFGSLLIVLGAAMFVWRKHW